MTIEAKIICDSISPEGIRLTSMQLRYPRFIHSELMTHRVLSRNASSSRAIPVTKMIEDLMRDPAMPVYWGANIPGMQAGAELDPVLLEEAKTTWLMAMHSSVAFAEHLIQLGLHKQTANRMLEPWAHINVVVSATGWANMFALRRHKDAQPEFHELADRVYEALEASVPTEMAIGHWHLPYVLAPDWVALRMFAKKNRITRDEPGYAEIAKLACKVSTARCARVSYLTHDGRKTTVEEDMELHDKLMASEPLHASPAEHQATPDQWEESVDGWGNDNSNWANPQLHGNFRGWNQYRKTFPNEFVAG